MKSLTPSPKMQFFDSNGDYLSGGKVYTYESGTTTPLVTYTDYGGLTPNTNPVILDSRGQASIWLGTEPYTFAVYDSLDTLQPDGGDHIIAHDVAKNVYYDDSLVGTTADNVQDALDRLSAKNTKDILDLINIPSPLGDQSYTVLSFFDGLNRGGGNFYWDSAVDKSTANGGTIVDPDNIGGFDGTTGTLSAFLAAQGTGVGSGCWVRISSEITPEMFGGGESTPDNTAPLQAANDIASVLGGEVRLQDGVTYVVKTENALAASIPIHYSVLMSSNVSWIGGPGTKIKLADDQVTVVQTYPNIFASNALVENVTFKGFEIDLNGDNQTLDVGDEGVAAIFMTGDAARAVDWLIEDMVFSNCPGINHVVLGFSNTADVAIGNNIKIHKCKFYQGALGTTFDHSSMYSWADNVTITDCTFFNELSNANARDIGTAFELHGSDCKASGNTITNFARGCYMAGNYTTKAERQIVSGNTFSGIKRQIVEIFNAGNVSLVKGIHHFTVSDNSCNLDGCDFGVRLTTAYDTENIFIHDNKFFRVEDTTERCRGVYIEPVDKVGRISVKGNKFTMLSDGVSITSGGAGSDIVSVVIKDNEFENLTPPTVGSSYGVLCASAIKVGRIEISDNTFSDDRTVPLSEYGVFLADVIDNIVINNNTYSHMIIINETFSASLTYQTLIKDNKYTHIVQADAGNDLVFTITYSGSDVIFNHKLKMSMTSGGRGYYKELNIVGYLFADALQNVTDLEILSTGQNAGNITIGTTVAVGANNQIEITIVNTGAAISGRAEFTDLMDDRASVISNTVQNNVV